MNSEDFESKARLYVLGALDDEELTDFERMRHEMGPAAERVIQECERLNSIFALSLRPTPPRPATKQRLLDMINSTLESKKKYPDTGFWWTRDSILETLGASASYFRTSPATDRVFGQSHVDTVWQHPYLHS